MMKVLILEDEPATARDLVQTLENVVDTLNVVSVIDSVSKSIALLKQKPELDLIISDVRLADGLCFEIFRSVAVTCPVLFCTAYNEYAIDAFQNNGIGYILKPFSEQDIRESLNKLHSFRQYFTTGKAFWDDLEENLPEGGPSYAKYFMVAHQNNFVPIKVRNIALFRIKNEIVYLHTFSNDKYLLSETLKEVEHRLDPQQFFRANRQNIINRDIVGRVHKQPTRKLTVELDYQGEKVIVSKAKATDFLEWLDS